MNEQTQPVIEVIDPKPAIEKLGAEAFEDKYVFTLDGKWYAISRTQVAVYAYRLAHPQDTDQLTPEQVAQAYATLLPDGKPVVEAVNANP